MTNGAIFIGLVNPKDPQNVGAVMRAAGCYGASEVRYSGERFDRATKFRMDTKKAKNKIPLMQTDELLHNLPTYMQIVCVELVEGATPLPTFDHPSNAIYLFGPEDNSIPQNVVDQADHVVYVPTIGCMNLAASVNVLLYDRMVKSNTDVDHSALIKSSRDTNNLLTLKRK